MWRHGVSLRHRDCVTIPTSFSARQSQARTRRMMKYTLAVKIHRHSILTLQRTTLCRLAGGSVMKVLELNQATLEQVKGPANSSPVLSPGRVPDATPASPPVHSSLDGIWTANSPPVVKPKA